MNEIEHSELAQYEAVIQRGFETFVEVGNALMAIREAKLYRQTHKNFEDYCQERWGMYKRNANLYIAAAKVIHNLEMGSVDPILPEIERHARPLAVLEPQQQREAWQKVLDTAPNGKITASHVQSIVDEYRTEKTDKSEPLNIEDSHGHVETVWSQPSNMAVHFSSDTPEHYTPADILDAVIACLGTIDLDPCSNSHESPNVPATQHFTSADDGLSQCWHGKVFMNPPYGREIAKWIEKLCNEYEAGRVSEAIALVPARTDTDWWDQLVDGYKFVCFVHGRLTFIGNEEVAPFPSAVIYLGTEWGRFYHAFAA